MADVPAAVFGHSGSLNCKYFAFVDSTNATDGRMFHWLMAHDVTLPLANHSARLLRQHGTADCCFSWHVIADSFSLIWITVWCDIITGVNFFYYLERLPIHSPLAGPVSTASKTNGCTHFVVAQRRAIRSVRDLNMYITFYCTICIFLCLFT